MEMNRNEEQLGLDAYARMTDPDTSHAAAEAMKGCQTTQTENLVLGALMRDEKRNHDRQLLGLTTDELMEWTGLENNTLTPRLKPLTLRGMIKVKGKRRAKSGRMQRVYVLSDGIPVAEPLEKTRTCPHCGEKL